MSCSYSGRDCAVVNHQLEDERSIANRLAAEEKKDKEGDEEESLETRLGKEDATLPVSSTAEPAEHEVP